jgi:hypothetical protein
MRSWFFVVALLAANQTLCGSAFGDPITIAAGSEAAIRGADSIHEGIGFIKLSGVGLDVNSGFHLAFNLPCEIDSAGCAIGDQINLSGPGGIDFEFGRNVIGGVSVDLLNAQFDFVASAPTTVRLNAPVLTPFAFTGHFTGFQSGTVSAEADVVGGGAMFSTLRLIAGRPNSVFLTDLRFEFGPTAPTPEPSTLLMLAGAVVAMLCRGFRRNSC